MSKKQKLQVSKIKFLNEDTVLVRLTSKNKEKLLDFSPGQYISFYYKIGNTFTSRPYSIASSPLEVSEKGYYDFIIFIGGAFTSKWFGDNLQVGLEVLASEPRGSFSYENVNSKDNIVCLAGGLSFTPFLSFVKTIIEEKLDKNIYLYIGWDQEEDVIFKKDFKDLSQEYTNVFYKDFVGEFIKIDKIQEDFPINNSSYFIAGPRLMDQSLKGQLIEKGVNPQDIISEVPDQPVLEKFIEEDGYNKPEFSTYKLIINGEEYQMSTADSILIAMERAGIKMETMSRSGGLDEPKVKLIKGQVFIADYWDQRSEKMKEENIIIPTVAFPMSEEIAIEVK